MKKPRIEKAIRLVVYDFKKNTAVETSKHWKPLKLLLTSSDYTSNRDKYHQLLCTFFYTLPLPGGLWLYHALFKRMKQFRIYFFTIEIIPFCSTYFPRQPSKSSSLIIPYLSQWQQSYSTISQLQLCIKLVLENGYHLQNQTDIQNVSESIVEINHQQEQNLTTQFNEIANEIEQLLHKFIPSISEIFPIQTEYEDDDICWETIQNHNEIPHIPYSTHLHIQIPIHNNPSSTFDSMLDSTLSVENKLFMKKTLHEQNTVEKKNTVEQSERSEVCLEIDKLLDILNRKFLPKAKSSTQRLQFQTKLEDLQFKRFNIIKDHLF